MVAAAGEHDGVQCPIWLPIPGPVEAVADRLAPRRRGSARRRPAPRNAASARSRPGGDQLTSSCAATTGPIPTTSKRAGMVVATSRPSCSPTSSTSACRARIRRAVPRGARNEVGVLDRALRTAWQRHRLGLPPRPTSKPATPRLDGAVPGAQPTGCCRAGNALRRSWPRACAAVVELNSESGTRRWTTRAWAIIRRTQRPTGSC
jgi:hypothetical protein